MNARTLRRGGIALAGAALLFTGGATQAHAATITMKLKGKGKSAVPYFTGPKTVAHGAKLKIVNDTAPKAIGPHTFSLVKAGLVPKGAKAQSKCAGENALTGLCLTIAKAHEVDLKTFKVSKPIVETGRTGWDTSFGKTGDSWYTETKGEKTSRIVTAKAGTTLTYFCAVHPNMVGKIKVK